MKFYTSNCEGSILSSYDIYNKMLKWLVIFIFLGGAIFIQPALAIVEIQASTPATKILDHKIDYSFGGQVIFWARFQFDSTPVQVQVFYKGLDETNSYSAQMMVYQDEVFYTHDLKEQPLMAFSEVEYWFGVTQVDGEVYVSPKYIFRYEDNRFDWKILEKSPFRVHWYEGDLVFGQSILDAAHSGLQRAQILLALDVPEKVEIYVYASGEEMQSTLRLAGLGLVAGHANPGLGLIIVSLPPGPEQSLEIDRQVPHELMHILLYQKLGNRYTNLPTWLNEGLASLNETISNVDYSLILAKASENKTLIPMISLCNGFPTDAANFYLAYAQSEAFTRFLYQQYGTSNMEALVRSYADGLDCERGSEVALGGSLSDQDKLWKEKSFEHQPGRSLFVILPWLILLGIALFVPAILAIVSFKHSPNVKTVR